LNLCEKEEENFVEVPVTESWSDNTRQQSSAFLEHSQAEAAIGRITGPSTEDFGIELQQIEKKKKSSASKTGDVEF